jgi:DNA-binding CsgD family transcriptional regulator
VIENWPIVGRRGEVTSILTGLKRGIGTVITGEAGVGKTTLAREVQRELDRGGWRSHLVRCTIRSGLPLPTFMPAEKMDIREMPPAAVGRPQTDSSGSGSGEPPVLFVDDAHVLDDESAELLWRLTGGGEVLVVATVRSGERAPDRVARLWADGGCSRLDLVPLAESDVRTLLEVALGGDVEDRLPRLLTRRADGNALLLRELVRSGVDSGAIARDQYVWRLTGELPVGAGVADIIRLGLSELNAEELAAAQLLAVGEPLPLNIAESLIGSELMESLEAKRVAALDEAVEGPLLMLGHPLYGEVLRSDIAPLRLRRLRKELTHAIVQDDAPRPYDVLRSVVWRLENGEAPDLSDLLEAARLARSFSYATAERIARAAVKAADSAAAVILLAEILIMEGRVAEAERLFDGLVLDLLSGEDRQAVTYGRALCRTRLGGVSDVAAMITSASADHEVNSLQLQAISAQALSLDGRIDEAMSAARPLFDDLSADPVTRTLAANCLVAIGNMVGQADDCYRIMNASLPVAEAARSVLPFGLGNIMVTATLGLSHVGRLDEADHIAQQLYDRALAEDDEWLRPRGASGMGVVALMRGRPRTATRFFRITVASLNELDGQYLCYNLSFLARGAALAGFVDEARQSLPAALNSPRFPMCEADWMIAEAAILAAEGALEAASEQALRAARQAASLGEWAIVGIAAHDAARYSGAAEAVQLAATAAERVDGPLHLCLSDYARARVADDPRALTASSAQFEALGTILFAAEASYAAARAFRSAGDGRAAAGANVRATTLHGRCENAFIPWVAGFQSSETLTRREQQTALLAAAGHPDSAIALELEISIRTVQNHLARVYRKLGVSNRRDLPDGLASGTTHLGQKASSDA